MRKTIFALMALIAATVFPASAMLKDYAIKVGQFDKIKVDDNVNVEYRQSADSTGYVTYRSDEDFADAFIFSVNNGTLRIQVTTEDVGKPGLPVVKVFSDFLTGVTNASAFDLRVIDLAPCPEFKAVLIGNGTITVDDIRANKVTARISTGNGTINLSGQTVDAHYAVIGTGTIQADRLKAEEVDCNIMGAGNIGCWPLEKLKVKGLGSTKIYYKGNPTIKKSGGGKLFQIPEDREDVVLPTRENASDDTATTESVETSDDDNAQQEAGTDNESEEEDEDDSEDEENPADDIPAEE